MSIYFDANGKHGTSGIHGADGARGIDFAPHGSQRDGTPGTDAGPAHDGESGGIMKVQLVSAKRKDGVLVAKVSAQAESPSSSRQLHSRSDLYVVPVSDLTTVDWCAHGGNGGRGGNGGSGGNGGRGRRGQNASEKEPGLDGDAGGSGGNGGRGTSGGNGGAGGMVELVLKERDTFLLMSVAGCDPAEGLGDRVAGGRGGSPGRHGAGGHGGAGGEGGDLYRYQVKNVTTQNSKNGVIQTVDCQYVTMNGGRQGPRGAQGSTPTDKPVAGQQGPPGKFSIRVTGDNDSEQVFEQRYSVTLDSVNEQKLSSMPNRDGIPTLEFGETVIVPSVAVRNTGAMPTPYQRVEIALDRARSDNLVISSKSRLHLRAKACVKPGETAEASQGYLRYVTWKPNGDELGDEYGPLQRLATRRLTAHQLGPEQVLDHRLTPMSRLSVEYTSFDSPSGQSLRLAYPVENRTGIVGLRILGAGESTSVRFSIRNTSTTALGGDSGRSIHVQYYLNDDEGVSNVGLEAVKFMKGPVGSSTKKLKVLSIDPSRRSEEGRKGHVVKVKNLPAGAERELVHTLMFSNKAKPFARASLQVDILLEDLPTLLPNLETKKSGSFSVVQRRKLVVVCQPTFRKDPAAEAILVTSSSTKASQHQAWITVLETMLGLKTETYSLCIHGHLDPSKDVMYRVKSGLKPVKLRDVFAGRMVIVLNDKFAPLPEESRHLKCRPSLLMARLQDYHPSTRVLLVGSDTQSTRHLSSLGSSIVIQNGVSATERTEPTPSGATERTADPTETDASVDTSATVKHVNSSSDTKLPAIVEPVPPNPQVPVDVAENDTVRASSPAQAANSGKPSSAEAEPTVIAEKAVESARGPDNLRQQSLPNISRGSLNAHLQKMKSTPGGSLAPKELGDTSKKFGKHVNVAVQHENIKSFKSWVLRALEEERKSGVCSDLQPGLNVASVKSKFVSTPKPSQVESELSKHASTLHRWLSKEDPVRVYVIEINPAPRPVKVKDGVVAVWGFGTLIIHRGVARDDQSIVEVSVPETSPSLQSPGMIQTMSVLYAVAATMDTSHKIQCWRHTFRGRSTSADLSVESARQVLRDSLVSDFLLDVSYLYDAKVVLDPAESGTCTSTLECLMTDAHIRELMGEASNNSDVRTVLEVELSDLIARLELSVDSRGEKQWWTPFAFNKSPTTLRLSQSVQRLKGAWTLYMNDRIIQERRNALEDSILHLQKEDSCWREALYHLHSPGDAERYSSPAAISVRRHSQMATGTTEPHRDSRGSSRSGETLPSSSDSVVVAAIPKSVRYTVDASDVANFEREHVERKRFSERVRRSLHETRSSFILS